MAIPNSYTEQTLADFMNVTIGAIAEFLKFTTVIPGSYDEAINNVLVASGTNDISTITGFSGVSLLRAYAKYYAWGLVAEQLANEIDYTHADSGATYKGSQYAKHALTQQDKARTEIEKLGGDVSGVVVSSSNVEYTNDLYTATPTGSTDNEWSRID